MKNIKVYTSPSCVKCTQLKWLMSRLWVEYTQLESEEHMDLLKDCWVYSLPIVDIDWEFVNFDEAAKRFINN